MVVVKHTVAPGKGGVLICIMVNVFQQLFLNIIHVHNTSAVSSFFFFHYKIRCFFAVTVQLVQFALNV